MRVSNISSIVFASVVATLSLASAENKLRGTDSAVESRELMGNPSSDYCLKKGGTEENKYDEDGSQWTVCTFPDGSACEEWSFFNEECKKGQQLAFPTYCRKNGVSLKAHRIDTTGVEGAVQGFYYTCQLENGNICYESDYYKDGYCL